MQWQLSRHAHVISILHIWIIHLLQFSAAYYKNYQAYGSGDTIILTHTGGQVDDQSRWAMECHDGSYVDIARKHLILCFTALIGEAMLGLMDGGDYTGFGVIWCKFMFPKKKPSFGIYPYYDYCNVRDVSIMAEYYCYDKFWPIETYDTFITAWTSSQTFTRGFSHPTISVTTPAGANQELFKCCKLPYGYHIDYSRCQYRYSHDKFGEHYNENNMFHLKCDRNHLLTGLGKAENPWTGGMHYVWAQCCPLFYDTEFIPLYVYANATLHAQAGPPPRTIYPPTTTTTTTTTTATTTTSTTLAAPSTTTSAG